MSDKIYTISELRTEQYKHNIGLFPYLDDWKRNPYTYLKIRFYMEISAVLMYFLLKTNIKPNTITILYGFMGIIGGIFLAIPNNVTITIAIIIFFSKSVLDCCDGHLARIRNQTSLTGHILDCYGAHLNALGFQIGLGFYVAYRADMMVFYYLIPLIPFFYAAAVTNFSYHTLFEHVATGNTSKDERTILPKEKPADIGKNYTDRYKFIVKIFDDRARSVDFILLLILLEMIFPSLFVTWIVFLILLIKHFIIFAGKLYLVVKKGWVERHFEKPESAEDA